MSSTRPIVFPPFRLDPLNRQLWRGREEMRLRPKSFSVLQFLARHPARLVTKQELLDAVWPETSVSDTVLKVCIREIREALGDSPSAPRFIATSHRSGYRFIAPLRAPPFPLPLSSFVGREQELRDLPDRLRAARLLTLTGAGGVGKTRLAQRLAEETGAEVAEGLFWVDLGALSQASLVPHAVAATLGVREGPGVTTLGALAEALSRQDLLLVLDNCEHLLAACAELATTLLPRCPGLRILATSRQPLGVEGETVYPVRPLALADPATTSAEELSGCESVRLFFERAVGNHGDPEGHSVRDIARLCRHLDGLPLAIELAAARTRVLSVEELLQRLGDRFRLLREGEGTRPPRHRTLEATLDWSYALLSEAERSLLGRLAVLPGSFSLNAVEGILASPGGAAELVDLLARLADRSLLVVRPATGDGATRYDLLETVRHYARSRLGGGGDVHDLAGRHARFFLALAEEAEPHLTTPRRRHHLARLDEEIAHFRAALAHLSGVQAHEEGLRLTGALFWFWLHKGYWGEGRRWLESALRGNGEAAASPRAKAHHAAGVISWAQGDQRDARAHLETAVGLWRLVGDENARGHSLHFLSMVHAATGGEAAARDLSEEAVSLFRSSDDRFGLATALVSLGVAAQVGGEGETARGALEESARLFEESGDEWGLALARRNLGIVSLRDGRYDDAVEHERESLRSLRQYDDRWFFSRTLESLAEALALAGDVRRAGRLFGAAERLRETVGAQVLPFFRADYEHGVAAARAALGEPELARLWSEGRAMELDEAIAEALDRVGAP